MMKSNFQHTGDFTLSHPNKWIVTSLHETLPLKPDCKNIIPAQIEKLNTNHQVWVHIL